MKSKNLQNRTAKGTFVKGTSGNPLGRPKGSRNEITRLKEDLELLLREQALEHYPEIMAKAIDMAKKGNVNMIKYMLGVVLTKGGDGAKQPSKGKITINIKGMEDAIDPPIDVTPKEENNETE